MAALPAFPSSAGRARTRRCSIWPSCSRPIAARDNLIASRRTAEYRQPPKAENGRTIMRHQLKFGIAIITGIAITGVAFAQSDSNSAPNPYREDTGWAKHGAGRNFGSTPGLALDRDGKSLWVFDRCGGQ